MCTGLFLLDKVVLIELKMYEFKISATGTLSYTKCFIRKEIATISSGSNVCGISTLTHRAAEWVRNL